MHILYTQDVYSTRQISNQKACTKTTSCHDFNHTVFKVLKGRPKDIDVEGERSEKKQGWAFSAFIEGVRGVNQGE